jgi:ankyrin repeat protein
MTQVFKGSTMTHIQIIIVSLLLHLSFIHSMDEATEECFYAVTIQSLYNVRQALAKGADVNYYNNGETLLYKACVLPNEKIVLELLKQNNVDVTLPSTTERMLPLHIAASCNMLSATKLLLQKNPQTTIIQDCSGNIPLHYAAYRHHRESIKILINHNPALINTQNYYGSTPLHIITARTTKMSPAKRFSMAKVLIKHGASPTIQDNFHATPLTYLFIYAYQNSLDYFDTFLSKHPHTKKKLIRTKDNLGNTQLHLCTKIHLNDIQCLEQYLTFLIKYGVDAHAKNNNNHSAIDLVYNAYYESLSSYQYALRNHYKDKKLKPIKSTFDIQEQLMHTFLRILPVQKRYALFTAMLQQVSRDGLQLPNDILSFIAQLYYILNIETIAANYYKGKNYYKQTLSYKHTLRIYLMTNPRPDLL